MRILIPAAAVLIAFAMPAHGQDILQSFGRFVDEVLPERGTAAPRPAPAPVEAVTPTPSAQRPVADEDEADQEGQADLPPLPRPRPEPVAAAAPEASVPDEHAEESGAHEAEARPEPDRIYQTACPAVLSGVVVGTMMEPIAEGICGERSPLSVTALHVNGHEIALSSPITTNCQMAGALADWAGEVDRYAKVTLGSQIATLTTGTSMMCRNRYGAADGFVSEHGFANALDVVGFGLADGQNIAVETDWSKAATAEGKLLRQAHGAACGQFTTVLGPEANADHRDHFHLDLGCHGQSCTAQICE